MGKSVQAAECKPCKTDTSTLGKIGQTSPSSCFCKDGTYPKYNKKNLEECLVCPTGATCKRPNNTYNVREWLKPTDGFWETPSTWENVEIKNTFVKCATPSLCTSDGCVEGTDGILCELCATGYGKQFDQCVACSDSSIFVYALVFIFVAILLVVLAVLIRRKLKRNRKYLGAWKQFIMVLKINIDFMQINSALPVY